MRSSTAGWNRGPDYAEPPELSWAPWSYGPRRYVCVVVGFEVGRLEGGRAPPAPRRLPMWVMRGCFCGFLYMQ